MSSVMYGTYVYGLLHKVKVLSYISPYTQSYDVEVYDETRNVSLKEANFINTEDVAEYDVELIPNSPG